MFASDYEREGDLILFPSDIAHRKKLLVPWREAGLEGDHPAKANLYLVEELIKHTTEPGQRIMDITAGAGSILQGSSMGRDIVAIEIAPLFIDWMKLSAAKTPPSLKPNGKQTDIMLLLGDCRDYLPMPADSIIFSPPYAGAFNSGGGILSRDKERGAAVEQYRHDSRNLGNLSNFLYAQAMDIIYKKCYDSLPIGGKISLIIKDRIRQGIRQNLGLRALKALIASGFELHEWHKWKPPGSMFTKIKQSKGETVVEDEDIIICRKVQ